MLDFLHFHLRKIEDRVYKGKKCIICDGNTFHKHRIFVKECCDFDFEHRFTDYVCCKLECRERYLEIKEKPNRNNPYAECIECRNKFSCVRHIDNFIQDGDNFICKGICTQNYRRKKKCKSVRNVTPNWLEAYDETVEKHLLLIGDIFNDSEEEEDSINIEDLEIELE